MSYVQAYYHLIFSTKNRVPVLIAEKRPELYKYIWGILKNKRCILYQIGGVEDHIHLFLHLHQSTAIANLVKEVKISSNNWIQENSIFPQFQGWQTEYGAFTKSHSDKSMIMQYIKNQEEHHKHESYLDEYKRLLKEHGIVYDERFLQ